MLCCAVLYVMMCRAVLRHTKIGAKRMTLLELLSAYRSIPMDLQTLANLLPRLGPRCDLCLLLWLAVLLSLSLSLCILCVTCVQHWRLCPRKGGSFPALNCSCASRARTPQTNTLLCSSLPLPPHPNNKRYLTHTITTQHRYYSISSSPLSRPGTCSITVGKVVYTSPTGQDIASLSLPASLPAIPCQRFVFNTQRAENPVNALCSTHTMLTVGDRRQGNCMCKWICVITRCFAALSLKTQTCINIIHAGRVHKGAASATIAATPVGGVVLGCIRRLSSHFRLPEDPSVPVIMVGPGTSVCVGSFCVVFFVGGMREFVFACWCVRSTSQVVAKAEQCVLVVPTTTSDLGMALWRQCFTKCPLLAPTRTPSP